MLANQVSSKFLMNVLLISRGSRWPMITNYGCFKRSGSDESFFSAFTLVTCRKRYVPTSGNQRFCQKCSLKWVRIERKRKMESDYQASIKLRPEHKYVREICVRCERYFLPTHGKQRYCTKCVSSKVRNRMSEATAKRYHLATEARRAAWRKYSLKRYYERKNDPKYQEKLRMKRAALRNTDKGRVRRLHERLVKYEITPQQYESLLRLQKRRCAICQKHQSKLKARSGRYGTPYFYLLSIIVIRPIPYGDCYVFVVITD